MKTPGNKEFVVTIDCDDTLVMWGQDNNDVYVKDPYGVEGSQFALKKHNKHIKLLKDYAARGYYVIVWSAGGKAWADAVVNALELNDYVDDVIAKPIKYIDDLTAEHILGTRVYLEDLKENS